jgi:hypothetical protein
MQDDLKEKAEQIYLKTAELKNSEAEIKKGISNYRAVSTLINYIQVFKTLLLLLNNNNNSYIVCWCFCMFTQLKLLLFP